MGNKCGGEEGMAGLGKGEKEEKRGERAADKCGDAEGMAG